jgi:hypothetical protein
MVSLIILLLNNPIMRMTRIKTRKGRRRKISSIERRRAMHTSVKSGTRTALHPTLTMKDLSPLPSLNPPSSQSSIILASWQKSRRYVHVIFLSILLLVRRNVKMNR